MIEAYKEAFLSCYPQKRIEVKPVRVNRDIHYSVVIDGSKGDRYLTDEELRSATRDFLRGKTNAYSY